MTPDKTAWLAELGEALRTQDNFATSHPIFTVQQRRRIYGLDPDYFDAPIWVHQDGGEADEDEKKRLDAEEDAGDPDTCWTKTGYIDIWEFVTACLTRAAAERYIERQRHNLKDPRVYVESAYRNDEWIKLREFILTPRVGLFEPSDDPLVGRDYTCE